MKIPFGKYKGKTLDQVLDQDPLYLDGLMDAQISNPKFRDEFEEYISRERVQRKINAAVY